MLYTIVNPSDPYTIQCNDLEIAFVACCLLGGGQYAFEPDPIATGSHPAVPLLLFGGVESYCQAHFHEPFEQVRTRVLTERALDLATALDSVVLGNRHEYLLALAYVPPAEQPAFRVKWHDERRSSLNDIGRRAWAMAARLRAGVNPVIPAPRQVFTG